jgi:hypothetical protein
LDAIHKTGLTLNSFVNNMNVPPSKDAQFLQLSKTHDYAAGKDQALLAQRRYGGFTVVVRVRALPDGKLLTNDATNTNVFDYSGSIPFDGFLEIYEVGATKLSLKPLYPNIS